MERLGQPRPPRMAETVDADGWRAAELSFRTGFEQSPVGMSLLSHEGRFLMANPALCEMLRRSDAELREMALADICHPEAVEADLEAMPQLLSGESQSLKVETRLVRADDQVVWVLMNALIIDRAKDVSGRYLFVQVQDITRTRRGERRTRSLTELRRKALAGMEVGPLMDEVVAALSTGLDLDCAAIYTLGIAGDLRLTTSAGCPAELLSATDEADGEQSHVSYTLAAGDAVMVADLTREVRFSPPSQLVAQGLVGGASAIINVRGAAHGVLAAYSRGVRPFSAADAEFVQAVADVLGRAIERCDHDEAQQRLNQQERLAAVGQLAAGVAHDFNNIVSAISLYAELLDGRQRLDVRGRVHVAAIRQQVERATALVWQVLDFANRSPLELVEVELSSFLADLDPILRSTMPEDVDIRLVDRGGPYVVQGDPTRLQQIFLNLATNAGDAFDGPGVLTITLSLDTPPEEGPLGSRPDQWVRVDVVDTGRGMPPDVLARVFEPFFTTKDRSSGTGLGLAQVHGLVSQHGGHIAIDSSSVHGTTVSLWLRRATGVMAAEEPRPPQVPLGRGERLAVVDDDQAVRTALGQVLESLGYAVILAADGREALGVLERDPSSLRGIVSDVLMPGMGGEDLARIVTARWPDLPVVLISGYPIKGPHSGRPPAPQELESFAGRVIRMSKPFTRHELAATLRTALG